MSDERVTPRDRLVATAAALNGCSWEAGEAFVAQLEREPDKPVQCPCCTKQVVLCLMHWQLHAPGTKCRHCESETE